MRIAVSGIVIAFLTALASAQQRLGQTYDRNSLPPAVPQGRVRFSGYEFGNCGGIKYHCYDVELSRGNSVYYTPNYRQGYTSGNIPDNRIGTSARIFFPQGLPQGSYTFYVLPHHKIRDSRGGGKYIIANPAFGSVCVGTGTSYGNINILSLGYSPNGYGNYRRDETNTTRRV